MYGYDASVISGSLAMPYFILHFGTKTAKGYLLTAEQTSLITAVPTAGTFLGAVIITLFSDRIGRKNIIWIACAIGVASSAIQTAAVNIAMFTVGRVFTCRSSCTENYILRKLKLRLTDVFLCFSHLVFSSTVKLCYCPC